MLFSPQKECGKDFSWSINRQNIHRTAEAKYLGVYLDEKLKWDAHIQHLFKKLSQYRGLFCHLRQNITQKYLFLLYHSLVYPHLRYGNLTWGSTNNSVLHFLQVLQNRLVRIIRRLKKSDHTANNSLHHKLNILKIKDIYHLEMAKFSSVARGGGLEHVFGAFEANFWWKIENSSPIGNWVPKLWSTYCDSAWKKRLNFRFWPKNQSQFRWRPIFFFWRSRVFGLKKRLNLRKISLSFSENFFFFFEITCFWALKKRFSFRAFREIPSQFSDKPCDSDSRTIKIRVKVVCTFLTLSKKHPPPPPPPFSNPGYAPGQIHVFISQQQTSKTI